MMLVERVWLGFVRGVRCGGGWLGKCIGFFGGFHRLGYILSKGPPRSLDGVLIEAFGSSKQEEGVKLAEHWLH